MATISAVSHSSLSSLNHKIGNKKRKNNPVNVNCVVFPLRISGPVNSVSVNPKKSSLAPLKASLKDEQDSDSSSSSSSTTTSTVAVAPEDGDSENNSVISEQSAKEDEVGNEGDSEEEKEKLQEMDWKTDEEFKKFMGNPSIEAAIKLEKKRADRKLKELNRESSDNPIVGLFNRLVRDSVTREKERLEKAEETFKALDLNEVITIR